MPPLSEDFAHDSLDLTDREGIFPPNNCGLVKTASTIYNQKSQVVRSIWKKRRQVLKESGNLGTGVLTGTFCWRNGFSGNSTGWRHEFQGSLILYTQ